MKKHRGKPIVQITDPEIEAYAGYHTTPESEEIKALIESSDKALDYIDMLSGQLVGQMLKMIVKISGAKRILEIGTFTGYSAIMMAEALPEEGEITTLEMNLRYQELSEKHFRGSAQRHKIELKKGNALEIIPGLNEEFDLVYLDADKLNYEQYFELVMPILKPGGLLITDNVLWDGTVLNPIDNKAQAIDQFNKKVKEDERVEQLLLPVRDGVLIIRKK